jgi:hypothetical protein
MIIVRTLRMEQWEGLTGCQSRKPLTDKKLIPKLINAIIKRKGMDLQLFGERKPKARIEEYIQRRRHWKKGDDKRLLSYTEENIRRALYYYEKNLKNGLKAPDGAVINITEDDFHKIIKDPKMLHKPEWIKEVIVNAEIKIKQHDGRYLYLSFNPAGYIATGEITYSSHHFGRKGQDAIQEKMESAIKKGGKIVWEKD